jgi:type II secretory pathway pseudopilin PulG
VSTEDAKESALQTNLLAMRNAIELYYNQHTNVYPGAAKSDGTGTATVGEAPAAFLLQLTQYTKENGAVSTTKVGDFKFGPYIKGVALPTNSFNNLNTVACDDNADITARTSDNNTGWKFYIKTGNLMANDGEGDHDNL